MGEAAPLHGMPLRVPEILLSPPLLFDVTISLHVGICRAAEQIVGIGLLGRLLLCHLCQVQPVDVADAGNLGNDHDQYDQAYGQQI